MDFFGNIIVIRIACLHGFFQVNRNKNESIFTSYSMKEHLVEKQNKTKQNKTKHNITKGIKQE